MTSPSEFRFIARMYGCLLAGLTLPWIVLGEPTPFIGGAIGAPCFLAFFAALDRWLT